MEYLDRLISAELQRLRGDFCVVKRESEYFELRRGEFL